MWLSEGLADLLASYKPTENGSFKAERMYFPEDIKLNEKSTRRLTRFLKMEEDNWHALSTYDSYGVSWALVNFLYREEPMLLREVIQTLNLGKGIEPLFQGRYKRGLKDFFQAVRTYYQD